MNRCFWADPTSMKSYFFFNDVIVFDTTYNTNKYQMIFAPFTGVNHHGQTVVFGCGLLSDEKTESFIWFLEQWLKAMPSGSPKVIITDQDAAIAKAIAQVLPDTFHRFCLWHIMFKFRDKLGPVIAQDYYGLFKASVYNSKTKEEFEASWKHVVQQSKQENHVWLNTMYELRSRWVPAFCNHIFHAGMQSSQRVESTHAFFKSYVSVNNSLLDFATRIKRGFRQQRHEELIRDHVDSNEVPKTKTYYPTEKLGPVIAQDYYGLFKASVYNSKTKEEFEASWKHVVQQSKQENHVWLNTMYELRSRWVPAFCNHIFHAGMQSSQRVESTHAFFKSYVSVNNSLLDFATRIKRGFRQQRHEELIRDHVDSNEVPKTKTYYPTEKQMCDVYTKEIFLRFQDEVVKSTAYLKCETLKEDEHECVYTVLRAADDEQSWKRREIVQDKVSGFAKCSCGGFEVEGIACRHIIFFFRSINMVHLPTEYILDRWTKNAKLRRVWDDDSIEVQDVGDKSLMMRYIQLSQLSQAVIDEASLSPESTKYLTDGLHSLRLEVKELLSSMGVEELPVTKKRSPQQILIEEPHQSKAKGSGKRLKSSKEIAMNKQRNSDKCGRSGHNIKTCDKHNTDGPSIQINPTEQSNEAPLNM